VDQFGCITRLNDDFCLRPVTAAEIEFYYSGDIEMFWKTVSAAIPLLKYEKERGRDQYEIALAPAAPEKTVADLIAFKTVAQKLGADFSAKPFSDQPGSGLHIHVHLEDKTGKNVFYKDDSGMSDALKYSIGGLLADVQISMPIFAPSEKSFARFQPGGNAPTTVSWGANNRTVAVRLPDKPHDKKHIEHRVAGADANPAAVMKVILEAIYDGLTRKLDPGPQVYGDASLEMYGLTRLA
jgi:glutamine synthetase